MTTMDHNADLCYASATKLIELFNQGTVTPKDVLLAQIARIGKYNSKDCVNAITVTNFDEALQQAEIATERYRRKEARALEGITVAVKDDCKVKGWVLTLGSIPMVRQAGRPATEDSPHIELLREAGAIFHIQTTVPELCLHAVTWSRLWGVTSTPWNTAYTSGGSSGGSAAALAAGFTTLATGSDIGGSIRIPSAFNGVCGFKPPFGRVPSGQIPYSATGPLARTMEDLALMQNIIAVPHPHDLPALRPKLDYPQFYEPIEGLKLAVVYPNTETMTDMDTCVRQALDEAVEVFRCRLNCTVDKIDLDLMTAENRKLFARALFAGPGMSFLTKESAAHRDLLCRNTRMDIDAFPPGSVNGIDVYKADELGTRMHSEVQDKIFTRGYTALLMPTTASPYVVANLGASEDVDHVTINGQKRWGFQYLYTWIFNLLSRYPTVNVPMGMAPNNVPLGLQVAANTYADLDAFRVASAYYNATPKLFTEGRMPSFTATP